MLWIAISVVVLLTTIVFQLVVIDVHICKLGNMLDKRMKEK